MAGKNEGCASIGCLGICFLFVIAMCTGPGPDTSPSGRYEPPAYPDRPSPTANAEQREWLYIHGTMNVRAEPDRDARIVRKLNRGDMVQLGPKDANGWARIYTGAAGDEFVYRASDAVRTRAPSAPQAAAARSSSGRRRSGGGRQLHVGPRGGCYYYNSNGNKTYVDRSECY
jgi:hypothetical protein